MWRTDTLWFEVAVVMIIFAIGSILFGHFEEHKPKWRRLLKVALVLTIVLGLSTSAGRMWAFGVLLLPILGAALVHLWWLPSRGVNGWTGEPKQRYYELIGHHQHSASPESQFGIQDPSPNPSLQRTPPG
jgi:type IV secretory pathway VirB2 component (pilin)